GPFIIKFSYIIENVTILTDQNLEVINLKKSIYSSALTIILCIFILASCQFGDSPVNQPTTKPKPRLVTIAAFGDTMLHGPQIRSGMKPNGEYHFDPFFTEVKPYLQLADLTIGNLETTLAGKERGYSGYPQFNAPDQIADALVNSGVDLMSTANNHSM